MHYVWQHRLFPARGLQTVDGRRLSVINPGLHNTDAGPDFFNATVTIDGQTWVGNVEIHVKASDWFHHRHDSDRAYDSVILHVVDIDDTPVKRPDGQIIPQMRMPCSPNLNAHFHHLTDSSVFGLPCSDRFGELESIYLTDWLTSLGYERMLAKAERVGSTAESLHGDWEAAAFITVARAMGFGVNNDPMEQLARSIGYRIMHKCSRSQRSAEALLLGCAGFLDNIAVCRGTYPSALKEEYLFLRNKFSLDNVARPLWKMSRMRPGNSPQRRLATLAALMWREESLVSRLSEIDGVESARSIFTLPLTGYWADHYNLTGEPCASAAGMSAASADGLIINAVVPILHAYGTAVGRFELSDLAIELLEELKSESNRIVKMFEASGIKSRDAFTSQALIQLRREYCEKQKCLYCRIGHRLLSAKALRP